jgi:hypothetical protein
VSDCPPTQTTQRIPAEVADVLAQASGRWQAVCSRAEAEAVLYHLERQRADYLVCAMPGGLVRILSSRATSWRSTCAATRCSTSYTTRRAR